MRTEKRPFGIHTQTFEDIVKFLDHDPHLQRAVREISDSVWIANECFRSVEVTPTADALVEFAKSVERRVHQLKYRGY